MLVLTRKLNESLIIGNNIKIKVVGIQGNRVMIGIEAPDDVSIVREELIIRKELEWADEGVLVGNS